MNKIKKQMIKMFNNNSRDMILQEMGGENMEATATEVKRNFGKYLLAAQSEPIIITKNGKEVGRLVGKNSYEKPAFLSLRGILPRDLDEKKILEEKAKQ